MLYRVRVSVPDRPGALLSVTAAVAEAGGNIADIEVRASADGRAIDDLVIDTEVTEPELREALGAVVGVELLGLRRTMQLTGSRPDLDLLARVAAAPERGLEIFVEMAATTFHADWAVALATAGDAGSVVHRSSGAPVLLPAGLPVPAGATPRRAVVRDAIDVVWDVATTGCAGHVIYLGRRTGPTFLQTELMHLRRVAELASALCTSREPAGIGQ